ncbi:MAG: hypothetical protein PHU07_10835, partial [Acidocella sp.]|nr:hypothetical protein [Acidocella sp.]
LAQLVGQFRIGAVAAGGHARPAAKPSRAASAPRRAPAAPSGKFVAVPKQSTPAGADDWNEF